MKIEPVILEGENVRLEPLEIEHSGAFCEVGLEKSLRRWTANVVKTPEDLRRYVETAPDDFEREISLPFVTIDKSIIYQLLFAAA